jgi:hypothetical protein
VATGTLRDHETLNLLLAEAGPGQTLESLQREPVANGHRKISLGVHYRPQHRLTTELAGDLFDDRHRHLDLNSSAICRKYIRQVAVSQAARNYETETYA